MSLLDQTIRSLASFLPFLSYFAIERHVLLLFDTYQIVQQNLSILYMF